LAAAFLAVAFLAGAVIPVPPRRLLSTDLAVGSTKWTMG
jgi:hypothetical protein